jgi:hypothetical protein
MKINEKLRLHLMTASKATYRSKRPDGFNKQIRDIRLDLLADILKSFAIGLRLV